MALFSIRSSFNATPDLLFPGLKTTVWPSMKLAIDYTTQLWQEGDQFVAHAMPLDVASSGATPDEARKALEEAVHLFLESAAEMGTLDQVLEDAGYIRKADSWKSPSWLAVERSEAILSV